VIQQHIAQFHSGIAFWVVELGFQSPEAERVIDMIGLRIAVPQPRSQLVQCRLQLFIGNNMWIVVLWCDRQWRDTRLGWRAHCFQLPMSHGGPRQTPGDDQQVANDPHGDSYRQALWFGDRGRRL